MRLHRNHRTCPSSRRLICQRVLEQRWSVARAAEAAGCSERTAAKWLRRYREGDRLLADRSSRPRRSPSRLPQDRVEAIERLRRVRMTAAEIAETLDLPGAAARTGWAARAAPAESASPTRWFAGRGVRVRAVMTDNGSAYISHAYAHALRELGLRHLRIRPGRPRTNGKAERLIQTLLNEWAYARVYGSSAERTNALTPYLHRYNYRRPHGSLGHQPPASRLNNLVRNYN